MNNENWDPTGYHTRKLHARICGFFVITMFLLVSSSMFFSQTASAQAMLPAIPTVPIQGGGTKQKITELKIRHANSCAIYKLVIDNNTFIVNTCGGLVLVPKATGTTRTQ